MVLRVLNFLVALSFLTRLPFRFSAAPTEQQVALSARYFGIVGALVGLFQGSIYWFAAPLGSTLAAVISVVATVLLTGALHHDGLADAADALVGGWSREQRLEILKDSRLGTYGVMALLLVVLFEVSAIAALPGETAFAGLVAAHTISKTTAVVVALTSAEHGDGLARTIALERSASVVAVVAASAIMIIAGVAWLADGDRFTSGSPLDVLLVLLAILVVVGFGYLCGLYSRRKIGAIRGDILGAIERLTFCLFLLSWVILHLTDK